MVAVAVGTGKLVVQGYMIRLWYWFAREMRLMLYLRGFRVVVVLKSDGLRFHGIHLLIQFLVMVLFLDRLRLRVTAKLILLGWLVLKLKGSVLVLVLLLRSLYEVPRHTL